MALATRLHLADLFDGLNKEEHQEFKEFAVERNKTLDKLVTKFEKQLARNWGSTMKISAEERHYNNAMKLLSRGFKEGISSEDVEQFSVLLSNYQDKLADWRTHAAWHSGIYLSAMIDSSDDTDFIIRSHHLSTPIDLIGYRNTKNVTLIGNAGKFVGCKMSGGNLVVNGNAYSIGNVNQFGEVENGNIEIKGDVGSKDQENTVSGSIAIRKGNVLVHGNVYQGIYYYGDPSSTIHIKGDVHGSIYPARMGTINIDGDYEKIALPRKGYQSFKIFHKGKQIVDYLNVNVPEEKRTWQVS